MKILHTADWHLGRYLHNFPLLEEQKIVLDQLVEITRREKPDLIIIAGDIYDRSVPPAEAVSLFDETIRTLVNELGTKVIAIAGNHDSPERIHCHSSLLSIGGFHVSGQCNVSFEPVRLADEHGDIFFYPVPYCEPEHVRYLSGGKNIRTHDEAWHWIVEQISARHPKDARAVLIAHLFAMGGEPCESERSLSVGGADQVNVQKFSFFDYTALGHLHCPQSFLDGKVAYSGSLLKYSLSEVSQPKSVSIVELAGKGSLSVRTEALLPRRDVRKVEGMIEGKKFVLSGDKTPPSAEDYLHVLLKNREIVLNPMALVQRDYPYTLRIEFPERETVAGSARFDTAALATMSAAELFAEFYKTVNEQPLDAEREMILAEVFEEILRES